MNDADSTNIFLLVWTVISGIVGILGFLLAGYLMLQEWHRHHQRLCMVLREVKYGGSAGDNHLVLLSLAFVNPSSVGKTVFHILGGAPNKENLRQFPYQRLPNQNEVELKSPSGEKLLRVPVPELLWLPLDIFPNQSHTAWYPALIQIHLQDKASQQSPNSIHLILRAVDVNGKRLALWDGKIYLKTYALF